MSTGGGPGVALGCVRGGSAVHFRVYGLGRYGWVHARWGVDLYGIRVAAGYCISVLCVVKTELEVLLHCICRC